MNTPNFPNDASHNQPVDPGDLKISPETLLSPEQMVAVGTELLNGFEARFPAFGAVLVEMNTSAKTGLPKDGLESGNSGEKVYTPGVTQRVFCYPGERPADDDAPDDFAAPFVYTFGKTITVRQRNIIEVPEPKDLQHKRVAKIVRKLVHPAIDTDTRTELEEEIAGIVVANLGVDPKEHPKEVEDVSEMYLWLIDRVRTVIAPAEAA